MFKKSSIVVGALVVLGAVGVTAGLVAARDDDGSTADRRMSIETLQLAASNTEAAESMQFELRSSGELGPRRVSSRATGAPARLPSTSVIWAVGAAHRRRHRASTPPACSRLGREWIALSLDRLGGTAPRRRSAG
jgi:hypothetical protein